MIDRGDPLAGSHQVFPAGERCCTLDRPADGLPPEPQPRRRAPIPSAGHARRSEGAPGPPATVGRTPHVSQSAAKPNPRRSPKTDVGPTSSADGSKAARKPPTGHRRRRPRPHRRTRVSGPHPSRPRVLRTAAGAAACDLPVGHPSPQARPTPGGPSGADRPKTEKGPALARRPPDHGCQHGGDFGRSCGKSLAPIAARRPRQRARRG